MAKRMLVVLAVLSGCPSARPVSGSWRVGLNQVFFETAEVEPSFGGLYLDGETVVLLGTEPSREPQVRAAVADLLLSSHLETRASTFVVSRFSWLDLDFAAATALSHCFEGGIGDLDLDERANRVVVGVHRGRESIVSACLLREVPNAEVFVMREFVETEQR